MVKIIKILLLIIALGSLNSYAEVAAPLGIEIGKSTLEDVKAKYKVIGEEGNGDEFGYNYYISIENLPLKNITNAYVNCNNKGVVQAVILQASKDNFESFFESMSKKYKLISKNIPFVGNKQALFQADNCKVKLSAPHMSFEMNISYMTNELELILSEYIKQEEQNKKRSQENAL